MWMPELHTRMSSGHRCDRRRGITPQMRAVLVLAVTMNW
jgi:hypothetical protein